MPGLRNTIALDFHLSQSALYWTDVVEDKIYRGKLLDNGGDRPLLLTGGLSRVAHTQKGHLGTQSCGPRSRPSRSQGLAPPSPTLSLIGLDFAVGLSS